VEIELWISYVTATAGVGIRDVDVANMANRFLMVMGVSVYICICVLHYMRSTFTV